jgi:hypothetical protein
MRIPVELLLLLRLQPLLLHAVQGQMISGERKVEQQKRPKSAGPRAEGARRPRMLIHYVMRLMGCWIGACVLPGTGQQMSSS